MKYGIIYADPPWRYEDKHCEGASVDQYPTMSLEDLKKLPVGGAAKDCVLFLWATAPMLREALAVIEAWGFKYKTMAFNWIKQNPKSDGLYCGLGHWTRSGSEVCLLATKGHPKRKSRFVRQVIIAHRGRHSVKPGEARERIVELMGDLPRLELFAREKAPGWDVWGDEVESDVKLSDAGPEGKEERCGSEGNHDGR